MPDEVYVAVGLAQFEGNTTAWKPAATAANDKSVPSDVRTVPAAPLANLAVAPELLPYKILPRVIASNKFNSAAVLVTPKLVNAVAALDTSDRLLVLIRAPLVSNAAATQALPLYTRKLLLDVLK